MLFLGYAQARLFLVQPHALKFESFINFAVG